MRLTNFIVLGLVLIFITASLVFYVMSEKTEKTAGEAVKLSELIANQHRVQGLVFHETQNNLNLIYLVSYEPITERMSWIYFSPETTLLSPTFARTLSLRELYDKLPPQDFTHELEDILDLDMTYWIIAQDDILSTLIDLLGGIKIQTGQSPAQNSVEDKDSQGRWLDGEMALQFVTEAYSNYGILGLRFRHKKLFMGIIKWLKEHNHFLEFEKPLHLAFANLETNLTFEDFQTTLSILSLLDAEKIKFLPAQEPQSLREGHELNTQRISTMLPPPVKYLIETGEKRELIRVQVLNGTTISGLAGSVRDHIQHYPFIDVVETGNANNSNHLQTIIIDRGGHPLSARRVKEILETGDIEIDLEEKLLVDITIVVGSDLKHLMD